MYDAILGVVSAVMFLAYALYYRFRIKGSRIQISLYLYMAMFPFNLARLPLPGSEYSDGLLKVMLLGGFLLSLRRLAQRGTVRINPYEAGMLVAAALTGLANGAVLDARSALYIPGLVNLGFQLLLSFHLLNSIRDAAHFRQVAMPVVVNAAVVSMLALYERFGMGIGRPEATLKNPNYFGLYVLLGLLCFWYFTYGRRGSLVAIGYQALAVTGIMLSGSSAVLAALLVAVLVRMVGVSRSRLLSGLLVVGMFGVVVFYTSATLNGGDTSAGLLRYFVKDDLSRVYIWKSAFESFLAHPMVGVGYATFRAPFSGFEYVTHNDYLRVLAELGLVGAAIFIAYVLSVFWRALSTRDLRIRELLLGSVLTILLFSLTHNNMNSITFWLFLALPYYREVLEPHSSANRKAGDCASPAASQAYGSRSLPAVH